MPFQPKSVQSDVRRRSRKFLALSLICVLLITLGGILFAHFSGLFSKTSPTLPVEPSVTATPAISSEISRAESLPLQGKTIFLDAGHGGKDNGCGYPEVDPTYKEKDFNLQITLEAKKLLEELGAEVILTRTDDSFISIYARPAMVHLFCMDYMKERGVSLPEDLEARLRDGMIEAIRVNSTDISAGCMGAMVGSGFSEDLIALLNMEYEINDIIFISVHNNWNSDPSLHGAQMYYVTDDSIIKSEDRLIRDDPYYSNPDYIVREHYWGREWKRNRTLSRFLHDAITEAVPELEPSGPELVENNFAVLREHGLASVMLELTYISCPEDRERLTDADVIRRIAEGIAQGCYYYYNNTNL